MTDKPPSMASGIAPIVNLNGGAPTGKEDIVPSKTAVLERSIPWEGYQRVGLVAPKDFELISVYDKKGITDQERNALLDAVCSSSSAHQYHHQPNPLNPFSPFHLLLTNLIPFSRSFILSSPYHIFPSTITHTPFTSHTPPPPILSHPHLSPLTSPLTSHRILPSFIMPLSSHPSN